MVFEKKNKPCDNIEPTKRNVFPNTSAGIYI